MNREPVLRSPVDFILNSAGPLAHARSYERERVDFSDDSAPGTTTLRTHTQLPACTSARHGLLQQTSGRRVPRHINSFLL